MSGNGVFICAALFLPRSIQAWRTNIRPPQELIAQAVTLTQPMTVLAPLLQQLPLCRRGADHELLDIRLELHEGVGRATCPITQPLLAELTPLRLLVDG